MLYDRDRPVECVYLILGWLPVFTPPRGEVVGVPWWPGDVVCECGGWEAMCVEVTCTVITPLSGW